MNQLAPGQAGLARVDGRIAFVACDWPELLAPFVNRGVDFQVAAGFFLETISGTTVPLVAVLLKLTASGHERTFATWINELAPGASGVLESLATQLELPVILASPDGSRIGQGSTPNGLQPVANKALPKVSELAEARPWTHHHFTAAKAFIESQYPTPAALWARLTADVALKAGKG